MLSRQFLLAVTAVLSSQVAICAPTFVSGTEALSFAAKCQEKADAMKATILGSKSDYSAAKGARYYVSAQGNDASDGLTPETAIRSLEAVRRLDLKPGDAVLFRRGEIFRGRIQAKTGVTYSAYGEGPKPTICSSERNYADAALWEKTDVANVWRCTVPVSNAGIVTFDHDPQVIGKYDVTVGQMRCNRTKTPSPAHLKEDLAFWNDMPANRLYLCSAKGNPGSRFSRIEIGCSGNSIAVGCDGVTVDNLHITLTGSHGVGAGTVRNLEVRNCVFDWLGGSLLIPEGRKNGPCLYGNAVEVYGGCDGYRVHDCWMYQIYDTGITHQCHHARNAEIRQFNVEHARNLIEYCFWSIEYYNAFNKFGETRNVYVHDNFCRFGGYGWGCRGRAGGAPMYSIDDRPDVTSNYVNEANTLERCLGILVNNFGRHASPPDFVFRKNVYVQPRGWHFAAIGDRQPRLSPFDETAADVIRETFGETDGTFVFLPEEPKNLPK